MEECLQVFIPTKVYIRWRHWPTHLLWVNLSAGVGTGWNETLRLLTLVHGHLQLFTDTILNNQQMYSYMIYNQHLRHIWQMALMAMFSLEFLFGFVFILSTISNALQWMAVLHFWLPCWRGHSVASTWQWYFVVLAWADGHDNCGLT